MPPSISFIITNLKAIVDVVNVTFQVRVRVLHNTASNTITPSLCSQGDVEQIRGYILHGVTGLDNEDVQFNLSNLGDERLLVYTLPENEYYSLFFEVFTTDGAMNTSFNNFCKTCYCCGFQFPLCLQQHMMSRVCRWKRK